MAGNNFSTFVKGWSIDVKRSLGSGTWSKVYFAFRVKEKGSGEAEQAAVKIIDKRRLRPREKHFATREIECLRRVESVGSTIRLLDEYEDATYHYLFLEYCKHGDLFELIEKGGKLSEPHARYVFEQLLVAVKGTHARGIIHRDLKIENILIAEKTAQGPNVVLCDYGLAAIVPNTAAAKLEQWVGSPEYAAPELINKVPYGAEVDVWALGVILYAIAVGQQPFTADTTAQIFHKVCVQPAVLPASMTDNLRDLLSKMLDKSSISRITLDEITNHPFLKSRPNKRVRPT